MNSLIRWQQWPLFPKLTAYMTLLIGAVVLGVTLAGIRRESNNFRAELEQQASLILDSVTLTAADYLYFLDVDSLRSQAERAIADQGVLAMQFYDDEGRALVSPAQTDENSMLGSQALGSQFVASGQAVFEWQSDRLIAGQPIGVANQTLGAVSVELSTDPLDRKIATMRNEGIVAGLLAIMAGAVAALFISRALSQPLSTLSETLNRLAEGELSERVTIDSAGYEILQLANAFNAMAGTIQQRDATLHALNVSLEQRVKDRTVELTETNEKLEIASRVKSEFLATMSHELRTPLNAIIGFADMLLLGMSDELTAKQHHKVKRLRENGTRLLTLVNNILDLARIEAQRVEILSKPFAPLSLAERLTNQMAVLAEQSQLGFETIVVHDMPETLLGDEQRIEQVIVNLLSNAFKFTEEGSVTLKMTTAPADKTWHVAVIDTGVGIPPHARDVIFEEFRQLDGSSTRAYKGSGLGLAITHNLVRMMGGQIQVSSELGQGSTFTVTLPLVEQPKSEPVLAASSPMGAS